jgi:hypothetical protein
MATQNFTIELDDSVYQDYLTMIRTKSGNPTLAADVYVQNCIKHKVKLFRLSKITLSQKETLIDMTGLE